MEPFEILKYFRDKGCVCCGRKYSNSDIAVTSGLDNSHLTRIFSGELKLHNNTVKKILNAMNVSLFEYNKILESGKLPEEY